jgi:hypothetical protein
MPLCINDKSKTYIGNEPSPKGLGYCAHVEKLFSIRIGLDDRYWYVCPVNKLRRWKLLKIPSEWFNNFNNLNITVKLDASNIWIKKYNKELKKTIIKKIKSAGNNEIFVYHTASWHVYDNKAFEKTIKHITTFNFKFSEQGLQQNGRAHLELDNKSVIKIIKQYY